MGDSIVVLGASSWIGHYLLPTLRRIAPHGKITALYRNRRPTFDSPHTKIVCTNEPIKIIRDLSSATIVNLNRGEEEADFKVHQQLISIQNDRSARYIYASSFNAVDAELSRSHLEEDLPESQSSYGQFKARCETEMLNSCKRPTIFRFSGTHGWAPNREARTQEFLKKLSGGEKVRVGRGILQNRSFVGDLAQQIAMLAVNEGAEGIFHLGTSDFSDEVDFHRKLASAFGYDPEQVVEGERVDCNAVMLMRKFQLAFPDYEIPIESRTIQKVAGQAELADLRKNKD